MIMMSTVTGYPFDGYDGSDASFEALQDSAPACRSECPDYPGLRCVVEGQHDRHYAMGEWWTESPNIFDRTRTCYIDMSRGPAELDASERCCDVRAAVAREGWDLDLIAKLAVQAEIELTGRPA